MKTFKTQGNAPSISGVTATLQSSTSAVLAGSIDPRGVDTRWYFEYGLTTSYGSKLPLTPGDCGSGTTAVPVSVTVKGLAASSTYHYALVASNAVGATVGGDHLVPTPNPPTVTSERVSLPSSTSAVLTVSINPSGLPTTVVFHWGRTSAATHSTQAQSAGSGTSNAPESASLTGLQAGKRYYWYVTAKNASGITTGPVKSFTAH